MTAGAYAIKKPRVAMLQRYGGGGHAVVGAVSLKSEDGELGRQYAKEIIEELQFAD